MKKMIVASMLMMFLALGTMGSWADDKAADKTLKGEVVCLSCYLNHGAMGEKHAKCGKQCASNGLPMGLKVGGKLYLIVGEHHGTAKKLVSSYIGKEVTVVGHVYEKDGMSMVEVESVKSSK
jgi:hypothetical protein